MLITKSDYLRFIQCPKFAWLFINRPDLVLPPDRNEQLKIEEGYQVEALAYKLFDGKYKIATEDKLQGSLETEKYIKEGAKIIHQATFIVDELYCRSDILKFNNETNKFDIYEIKATTEVDKQHIKDLAFQKIVLEKQGLSIGETYVVHVNNQYIRNGEIDINQYFSIENKTIEVIEKIEEVKNEINKFKEAHKTNIEKVTPETKQSLVDSLVESIIVWKEGEDVKARINFRFAKNFNKEKEELDEPLFGENTTKKTGSPKTSCSNGGQ